MFLKAEAIREGEPEKYRDLAHKFSKKALIASIIKMQMALLQKVVFGSDWKKIWAVMLFYNLNWNGNQHIQLMRDYIHWLRQME